MAGSTSTESKTGTSESNQDKITQSGTTISQSFSEPQNLGPNHMHIPEAIAASLVKVQLEVQAMGKTAENGHFKNTYAPLDVVMDTALPLLTKHDLGLMQWPITVNGEHYLHTVLAHTSGVSMQSDIKLLLSKKDPQGLGSAITYERRQTVMAILGLSAKDEDDDGNKASGHLPPPTQEQLDQIAAICADLKYPPEQLEKRIASLRTEDHATVAIANLNKVIAAKAREVTALDNAKNIAVQDDKPIAKNRNTIEYVTKRLQEFGFKDSKTIKQFIFVKTQKPLIGNCKLEDLEILNTALDRISSGEEVLPDSWLAEKKSSQGKDNA